MTSSGNCRAGGPLTVPGIPVPKTPVAHTAPTAMERLAAGRPQPKEQK